MLSTEERAGPKWPSLHLSLRTQVTGLVYPLASLENHYDG